MFKQCLQVLVSPDQGLAQVPQTLSWFRRRCLPCVSNSRSRHVPQVNAQTKRGRALHRGHIAARSLISGWAGKIGRGTVHLASLSHVFVEQATSYIGVGVGGEII